MKKADLREGVAMHPQSARGDGTGPDGGPGAPGHSVRANQKARTRRAIVDACRELTKSGADMTMLEVARAAMVSEATAYRYFPDLVSLLREALTGLWPDPARAMEPVSGSADPVERVAFACEYLLRGVLAYQGSVRAMISHAIAAPGRDGKERAARARPGIRFGLIDYALAPFGQALGPQALARLRLDLAVVVSAEALFTLTDLCGLSPDDAIASATATASTLTRAAFGALPSRDRDRRRPSAPASPAARREA